MLILSGRAHDFPTFSPSSPFQQLVDRRLAIAQKGLAEARRHLKAGHREDANMVLEKIDEDLHLLRCRLDRETETDARRPSVICGRAGAANESN